MRIIFFLTILFFIPAVNAQDTPEYKKVNPEVKRFVFQPNTIITKRIYDSIYFDLSYDKGKKWVFMYSYKAKDYEMIADDEYFESIIFEIDPPKGNTFSIKTPQFLNAKVIYNRGCFCPDAGLRQLYEGTITGRKNEKNIWVVSIDVQIEPRPGREGLAVNKKLKGNFKSAKLIN
ncbi:MAG: hypothetical protein H7296_08310 [Bacteroidia bacterium]|nr:hypothetical protein [Bacteroidia bacterium]